jgi:amino acid transporter
LGFFVVAVVSLRWIATAAATGPGAMLLWLVALGGLFVPLCFAVMELAGRYPQEGGLYVWTRRAFGDSHGFMAAWMYWASNLVYFPGMLYFTAGNALYLFGSRAQELGASPLHYLVFSFFGLALALGFNLRGLHLGKRLTNAGAWATMLPIAALVVMGGVSLWRFGSATGFGPAAMLPHPSFAQVAFWSTLAFAFGGFEAAPFMGEEMRDARRDLPRAILAGGAAIAGIYMLGTLAVLVALPAGEVSGLQGIMQAIDGVATRTGAPAVTFAAAALVTLSGIAGVAAWLGSVARLPFVAGVDRLLPPAFGRLHPRWGTPVLALWTQAAGAAIIVVLGQAGTSVQGAYDALVGMGVITYFIPFLYLFAALIRLQREPAGAEVRRVPGGRRGAWFWGGLGFTTTAVSIVLAVFPPAGAADPALSIAKVVGLNVVLMALGAIVYTRRCRAD